MSMNQNRPLLGRILSRDLFVFVASIVVVAILLGIVIAALAAHPASATSGVSSLAVVGFAALLIFVAFNALCLVLSFVY